MQRDQQQPSYESGLLRDRRRRLARHRYRPCVGWAVCCLSWACGLEREERGLLLWVLALFVLLCRHFLEHCFFLLLLLCLWGGGRWKGGTDAQGRCFRNRVAGSCRAPLPSGHDRRAGGRMPGRLGGGNNPCVKPVNCQHVDTCASTRAATWL